MSHVDTCEDQYLSFMTSSTKTTFSILEGKCPLIVHPESFISNEQNAFVFARRNRPCVDRNDEFACVYLRLRACVCVRLRVLFAIDFFNFLNFFNF